MEEDIRERILMKMSEYLDIEKLKTLEKILYTVFADYDIKQKEKSIVPYDGGEVEYMLKKFLVVKKIEGCTDRTIQFYATELKRILPQLNKPFKEVISDDIVLYLANRELNSKISKITLDNDLRCMRTFFNWLTGEDYITRNPCLKIKPIKKPKIKKPAFTEIEIEKMRCACKDNREKALMEVLLSTGCRASEVVQIKTKEALEGQVIIFGKGSKERTVYINAKAMIAITNYTKERTDDNEYLFPRVKTLRESSDYRKEHGGWIDYRNKEFIILGEHASKDWVGVIARKIGERVGVKSHAHKFRRTCATMALRRGMPLLQVSKMLGHEQVDTTQIYLDISEEELEQSHRKYVI